MMTAFATQEKLYTIEEYLEMEEPSKEKHEYYNGKIREVPGGSTTHNLIVANTITGLNISLEAKGENFLVYPGDMRIYIPRTRTFVYSDAVVVCESVQHVEGRTDTILNPLLVVEVLSPSTARDDGGPKFHYYKSLPSFKEYVLIEQDFPLVVASFKTAESTWKDLEASSIEQSIFLRSLNCSIDLKRIYRNVTFDVPLK